jgi:hypothetical protein
LSARDRGHKNSLQNVTCTLNIYIRDFLNATHKGRTNNSKIRTEHKIWDIIIKYSKVNSYLHKFNNWLHVVLIVHHCFFMHVKRHSPLVCGICPWWLWNNTPFLERAEAKKTVQAKNIYSFKPSLHELQLQTTHFHWYSWWSVSLQKKTYHITDFKNENVIPWILPWVKITDDYTEKHFTPYNYSKYLNATAISYTIIQQLKYTGKNW